MAVVFLTIDEWGGHSAGRQQMRLPVDELWVHHSVTNEDLGVNPTADAIADFRELDAIGLSRGHGGISYSYAIHPSGVIGEGQGTRIGAHTAVPGHDRNPWSFGVCFIGNFDPASGDDTPTPAAIDAFRWLRDEYLILNGWLLPGTYPTGGHRDAPGQATGCPGNNLEGRLDDLRRPWTAVPAPTPQEGDAMFYFGEHPTKPGIALGLLVESGVVTCQLEGPPDGYGFPPAAGIWINGGPGVGNGPVPWRRVQPYVLGWLLQTHDDVVNRRYVGMSGAAGSIDPAAIQAAVRAELDKTILKAR